MLTLSWGVPARSLIEWSAPTQVGARAHLPPQLQSAARRQPAGCSLEGVTETLVRHVELAGPLVGARGWPPTRPSTMDRCTPAPAY